MPTRTPARIVIVEDHVMVRQIIAHVVRDLGHEIAGECETIADGRTTLLKLKPDLAIVDWALPDGRGPNLVAKVTAKLPATRWLLLSAHEQAHIVREAGKLGIQGLIMKRSSSLEMLREAIGLLLDGEKYYCPVSTKLLVDSMAEEASPDSATLTLRERDVLQGIASGQSVQRIADRFKVSPKTIQNQVVLIKDKLGLSEVAELVHYAIKHGYIEPQ